MSYQTEVLADSPFAYWRLQETSGSTFADSSGNGRGATGVGTVTVAQSGPFAGENAVKVANTSDIASTASYAFTPEACTLECWFKRPDTTTYMALMKHSWTNSIGINLTTGGALRMFNISASSSTTIVTSTTSITDTNWHHLAATKNGASVHLYIDGQDVTGTATNQTLASGTSTLKVGEVNDSTTKYAPNGTFAEAAFYTSALSASRILTHYNASLGLGGDLVGMIGS